MWSETIRVFPSRPHEREKFEMAKPKKDTRRGPGKNSGPPPKLGPKGNPNKPVARKMGWLGGKK